MFLLFNFLFFVITTLPVACISILEQKTFIPHAYDTLEEEHRKFVTSSYYQECIDAYAQDTTIDWDAITYRNDDLLVKGFIIKPKQLQSSKRYPVILYARGGFEDVFKTTVADYFLFKELVEHGYVIITSQNRGCDGGQGQDNFGGDDIQDFIACKEIAQFLEYADLNNLFLLGWSRGAITICRSLTQGLTANAIAIGAGLFDFFNTIDEHPIFESYFFNRLIFNSRSITLEQRNYEYTQRSAFYWPHKINIPTLLLHGEDDQSISFIQSYNMAHQLALNNVIHRYIAYPHVNHHILNNKTMRHDVISWFEQFKRS